MAELILMTQKELARYEVIQRLIRKEINGTETAKQLELTSRQIKNIKARVIREGTRGVVHKSRGRVGSRRLSLKIIEEAKHHLRTKYSDFKPTFAMEKLTENHQIKLSKEKVRQIMIEMALWQPRPRKKNKEYRSWRQRKDYYGEMQQFDGCYFDWFETGELSCLLASRDDATNRITKLKFVADEGLKSVSGFWKEYFLVHGKPLKIYLDRLSTYKNTHKSVIDDPQILTQFQRMMRQSDVELISAYSCQAKGRIENLFPILQHLAQKQPVLVRKKERVLIEERISEEIFISLRGKYLNYTVLPERPKKVIEAKVPALTTAKSSWKPPANHPWRQPFILNPEKRSNIISGLKEGSKGQLEGLFLTRFSKSLIFQV